MTIDESVQFILSREGIVTDLFYSKYLDRYPNLREYFEGVDLSHQSVLLKMALMVIHQFYEHKYPAAEQYLKVLGFKHGLKGIPESLYADWRTCMCETLQHVLAQHWSSTLESHWGAAMKLATDTMLLGYEMETANP